TNVQYHTGLESRDNIQPQNPIDIVFKPEILPFTVLNNQPNASRDCTFSLSQFIDNLKSIQNLHMTDFDGVNFEILFRAELDNMETDIFPTSVLHNFGVRFGPWIDIVKNIR